MLLSKYLVEVSAGRRNALRGYCEKIRLGIFRSLDAHGHFSWRVTYVAGCIPMKMFCVNY